MARKRNLPTSQATPMFALPPNLPSPVVEHLQGALLTSFREVGPALLEQLSRTDPKEYRAWFAMALEYSAHTSPADGMRNNVINIVSAIPRSPLDTVPEGFGK